MLTCLFSLFAADTREVLPGHSCWRPLVLQRRAASQPEREHRPRGELLIEMSLMYGQLLEAHLRDDLFAAPERLLVPS